MTINQSLHQPGGPYEFSAENLRCTNCHTDRHLMVESIQPPDNHIPGLVSIEYSCGRCEAFFAHDASVENVAKLLAKSPCDTGVLRFGNYYIHCGEPMTRGRITLASLHLFGESLGNPPAVDIPTAVLRCTCGFQISILS